MRKIRALVALPFGIVMLFCLLIVHVFSPELSKSFWKAFAKTILEIEQ